MASQPIAGLHLDGIAKRFDGGVVLDDVSLAVPDGATLSLLGPSGSGKTTLLRIVAGLDRPDRGTVMIGGGDVTRVPTHQRGVGVVFQDRALFPHLDVGDNVGYGLRMAGMSRSDRRSRVAEALAAVGLAGFEDRDVSTLSGGEGQRVALARALAPRPSVLLLDEPLAALDQVLRESLLLELRTLFDELAVTVIAVTHDPAEAVALGDEVAVLDDGSIAQIGPWAEVVKRPTSAAVARLLGHRNLVDGEIHGDTVRTAFGSWPIAPERPAGAATVLVPPDAIVLDEGPATGTEAVRARVVGHLYRGGSSISVVASGTSRLDVLDPAPHAVGATVGVVVDAGSVVVFGSA